ncbi:hypothetical protein BDV32DRAFT_104735 [Aspergillus pseudonomiae]|nr:hypothetical protein BDV32DRAFT_104735 [Aspergillus pseudonomiae]
MQFFLLSLAPRSSDCHRPTVASRHLFSIFTPVPGFLFASTLSYNFLSIVAIVDCIIHLAGVLGLSLALSLLSYGLDDE